VDFSNSHIAKIGLYIIYKIFTFNIIEFWTEIQMSNREREMYTDIFLIECTRALDDRG